MTTVRLVQLTPRARQDLRAIARYLRREGAGAAVVWRFRAAVERTLTLLAEHPWMGTKVAARHRELSALRAFVLRGFESYMIFYLPSERFITVLRVLHGARDLERLLTPDDPG
ncbi:MAG TPA: type II toxin-antitoxin system RelE/ParE family toxin [Granulicella sp.]|nr:type II toxin-antitoxin system RelE/ParE family toxin [Granulicella sp.]